MYADHLRGKRHRYATFYVCVYVRSTIESSVSAGVFLCHRALSHLLFYLLLHRALFSHPLLTACRARIIRLEQQLKAAHPDPKVPRTWATTLVQDCSAVAAPCAAAPPADAQRRGSGKGRRASCPEANALPSPSYRAHRQALEEQQRTATAFMSDKGKVGHMIRQQRLLRVDGIRFHGVAHPQPPTEESRK